MALSTCVNATWQDSPGAAFWSGAAAQRQALAQARALPYTGVWGPDCRCPAARSLQATSQSCQSAPLPTPRAARSPASGERARLVVLQPQLRHGTARRAVRQGGAGPAAPRCAQSGPLAPHPPSACSKSNSGCPAGEVGAKLSVAVQGGRWHYILVSPADWQKIPAYALLDMAVALQPAAPAAPRGSWAFP